MKYWWVNHKQTFRQEVDGEYLWSPKLEANGRRSHFYDNMRIADRGDLVLSYANQLIKYVGIVSDSAISAPKPNEFRSTGDYWSNEGWRLPIYWIELPQSVYPKEIFSEIKNYFSKKYSPLNDQGNGNQKAYLSEISEELFNSIIKKSKINEGILGDLPPSKFDEINEELEIQVEQNIANDAVLSDTEKRELTLSRRGQGVFRKNVIIFEKICRITGVANQDLLIASHIRPWRSCRTAQERLDGNNGLMLTPSIDRLFDKGFVSFSDDGELLISKRLNSEDVERIGLNRRIAPRPFSESQINYLYYHRENVFQSTES